MSGRSCKGPFKILVLPGDGIGPEIIKEAVKVLKALGEKKGITFNFQYGLIGGAAIDERGVPLPEETVELGKQCDAILLGAVGGPKWDNLPPEIRPELGGLLKIRKVFDLYANLRPVMFFPELKNASPLKPDIIEGVDILMVRELTGGLYFGEKKRFTTEQGEQAVIDTLIYTEKEVERVVRLGFELAQKRRGKLTLVDKANVLESSRFWREITGEIKKEYPDVELSYMYVDNCAMQLIRNPRQFDVIVTENMFGDILTDEGSVLAGSIGLLPSASLNGKFGLYEPIHGSAPDIAGQNKANPLATILSAGMMLRYSLDCPEEALLIEKAVKAVLQKGYRTGDILEPGTTLVTCEEMGDLVAEEILGGVYDEGLPL
ncbi:3-isopropylmalate dehydrogenase [Carboxydothermus hydrogenoformans]|uniref:3-isopropylmalate dehydrogenase n=1 Tax=Carboxydothermus hydrogenoformans (strain ATCC BAA-161 / DSM 6008 / Z-2901) TaxID=246194 RepID=LEU3_CARHZ|nr:3-isopropylmalate dehydrogenase [Carboxydothermus hydrogenoformans]Q3AEQ2.1 RecName: Full=3-isopropylmalate dehydrogenase; AltName: Full=3-IPM-DH; AltName: Full=Beta-IPM dehydrogenase; Short=IMDH [Carboxydothermus hydrogenoformans Z-2901]ABB15752.1 3-isopropylmalate dehydrogenase [Carboxydothermus hydrogenoformans Z-2901]